MAYFTANDEIRTLEYLGLAPNNLVALRNGQKAAYNTFGDAIVIRVQAILTQLDELDSIEATYAKDASSSLIRADVLEWDPNGRFINLYRKRNDLISKLSQIFNLANKTSYEGTRIYKS